MPIFTTSSATGIRVEVSDQVTVQNAEEVLVALLAAIASATGPVTIDLAEIKKVDVTFFQLLLALDTSLKGTGRVLRVVGIDGDSPVGRAAELVGIDIDRFKGGAGATK